MILGNPAIQALLRKFLLSQLGIALKNMFWSAVLGNLSSSNTSQSGQAGAVPGPDTAPLTGGPHEDPLADTQTPSLQYVDDRTATNFHQHTNGSMADVANNQLEDEHGTNGASYDNKNR